MSEKSWGTAPFTVVGAAAIALCKALFLVAMGIIGIASANSVSNPFGAGILVFGLVYAAVGYFVPKGSNVARIVLALLSLVTAVVGLVYAFTGPSAAVVPSLVAAGFAILVVLALYWPQSARAYFER